MYVLVFYGVKAFVGHFLAQCIYNICLGVDYWSFLHSAQYLRQVVLGQMIEQPRKIRNSAYTYSSHDFYHP